MSVRTAFTKTAPLAGGQVSVAAVALVVAIAALAGLLVGGLVRSKPAPAPVKPLETVSGAGVRVQLPNGWARGDASAVPGFPRALWLQNPEQGLRAAVALLPASSPTLLPATSPADARAPETVRLRSGYEAWRYRGSLDDGSPVFLYAAPTTTGIATVACVGATGKETCDALASAVAVPNSRRLELGERAAFFSGLPSVVAQLDSARTKGLRALDAASNPVGQELAALDLSRAHKAAAKDLAALGGPAETVGSLTATATAYGALSRAANARLPKPYVDAGRAVTSAEAGLQRTMTKVAAGASSAVAEPTTVRPRATVAPPKATATAEPPKATATAEPPKATATAEPPKATATAEPPKATATAEPPKATATAEPPKAIATAPAAEPIVVSKEKSSGGMDLTLPLLGLIALVAIFMAGRSMRSSWADATAGSRNTRA